MYFYEIEVYHPLVGSDKIVMSHDDRFDNHQLNVIVQEAFDECIKKYCNKTLLEKGEEACRMEVETIFEKHLPSQLQNHGFNSIKINATCLIQSGALFSNDAPTNIVLKNRYKDKILPPCKKCMREAYFDYDGKCVVPNTRKNNSLPTTRVVKTIPIDLNEEEENKNDFNISIVKQYFVNSHKSSDDVEIVYVALEHILDDNDFDNYYLEQGKRVDGIYTGDIVCGLDMYEDKEKCKKLLEDYGFILEDEKLELRITGVKEFNLNEKEEVDEGEDDDFYVGIIKLYLVLPEKSFKTAQRAMEAIDDILYNHGVGDFWTDFGADDSSHAWDIICDFTDEKDRERFRKLFMDYGFDIENATVGFWITGVKE